VTPVDRTGLPAGLRLGTSSFSNPDWRGRFYPENLPPEQFLAHYATILDTVEIDATWHAIPSRRTVEAWRDRVPSGFTFAVKAPRSITHDRYLQDCAEDWGRFLELMDVLGDKRGPVLFQFQYVARGHDSEEYRTGREFRRRLEHFLTLLPEGTRFALEVRNRTWINDTFLDLLRKHGLALAFTAYQTMPEAAELLRGPDPVTADFGYVRFLGNHTAMDNRVARAREVGERDRDWGELMVDKTEEMRGWISPIRTLLARVPEVFVYFNNHYAGYGPGSLELFVRLWREEEERRARGK
jgi:uncharacterized protein YecE (DUF72 family)